MQILFSIIVFVLGVGMFFFHRRVKLSCFIISAMCFCLVSLPIPGFQTANRFLILCFILSEIGHFSFHKFLIKKTILWFLIVQMTIATLILFINSPHYLSIKGFFNIIFSELFTKYFVIAYSFVALTKESDLKEIYKISLIGITVLTFFSVINYLQGYSDFVDLMVKGRDVSTAMDSNQIDIGKRYFYSERIRVQGMFILAFDYGYTCAIFLLFYLYGLSKKHINKYAGLYAIACCTFGIIVCHCRTVLIASLVSVLFYYIIQQKGRYVNYLVVALILFVTSYNLNDQVHKFFDDNFFSVFDKGQKVAGSSLEMRAVQYTTVFLYIKNHELFGRGCDYFLIDMGWKEGREYLVDKRLQGVEGVLLLLLLERGYVGVFFWALFYILIFIYFYKKRNKNIQTGALGLACLVLYLLYANMTGEMGCAFPTMLVLGISIKLLFLVDRKNLSLSNNKGS